MRDAQNALRAIQIYFGEAYRGKYADIVTEVEAPSESRSAEPEPQTDEENTDQ